MGCQNCNHHSAADLVACRGNPREHDATSTAGEWVPRYRLHLVLYQIASTNRRCAMGGDASQRQQWAQMMYSRVQAVERALVW